jgi:hypothetical protein
MRTKIIGLIILNILGQYCFGQSDFKSDLGNYSVTIPSKAYEKIDTVKTEFGKFPRYLMLTEIYSKGRNLVSFRIEILDYSNTGREIPLDSLKSFFVNRKKMESADRGFYIIKEEKINDPTLPYQMELILTDRLDVELDFIRIFKKGSKFYSVEAHQLKRLTTKPRKETQKYFESFRLFDN